MACLEHLARHRCAAKGDYSKVSGAARVLFFSTLFKKICFLSGRGRTWSSWLEDNKGIACYVLDASDVEVVLLSKDNLKSAVKPLQRIYKSCTLAKALLSEPRDRIASELLAIEFETDMKPVVESPFSDASFLEMIKHTDSKIATIKVANVHEKRSIPGSLFETMSGAIVVATPEFEREVLVGLHVRAATIGKLGGLTSLPHEKLLMPTLASAPSEQCQVGALRIKD